MALNEEGIKQFAAWAGDGTLKVQFVDRLCLALGMRHAVVFCNRWERCEAVARALRGVNLNAEVLLPGMLQSECQNVLDRFLAYGFNILVTSGAWPQGLPVESVNLVFNYDFPRDAAAYAEQIGGCDRVGVRKALVITLVLFYQVEWIYTLESKLSTRIDPLPEDMTDLYYHSFPLHLTQQEWENALKEVPASGTQAD